MTTKAQKRWILLSLIGIAYWFFGNLYEEIVIAPNWVSNSPEQMRRLHEFFVNTSPTHYFVPLTQLATLIIWVLYFTNTYDPIKRDLRLASIFGVLVTVLNFFIVGTIVLKLFSEEYMAYRDELTTLCWRWNFLNIIRMALTALTIYYVFNAFRILDRIIYTKNQ